MFPGIQSAIREWLVGENKAVTSLDIEQKTAGGIAFDAINVGWYARNGFPAIYSILSGGMPAWSGEPVSAETALNHSVVWACYRLISESIGLIPCIMLQRKATGKEPALKHPMYNVMLNAPSDEITSQAFTEMLTGHVLLQGNAFAQIIRRSGTGVAIGLWPLQPSWVIPDRELHGKRRLVYVVKVGQDPSKTYVVEPGKPHEILHIRGLGWDGIRGFGVVTMARQSIGTAISSERNLARFYANGGRVPYVLTMPNKFKSDQEFDKFRTDWERTYQEPHRAPILEGGLEYKQIGLNARDAQMLETRQFSIPEICRWFLVSPHLVGDLSRATFANIEHLALQFIKMTLNSWLTRWEQELWRCVLTPDEKEQGLFFHHDVRALLRGDFATRMAGYASALQNGHMSIDEVRDEEDRNPLPDGAGSHNHIQLNMQTLPGESDQLPTPPAGEDPEGAPEDQTSAKAMPSWLHQIS